MPRGLIVMCLTLTLVLIGCGGSAADSVRASVSNMQSAIQSYNGARPSNLAGTAAACRTAYDNLGKQPSILTTKLSGQVAREQRVLRTAYTSARGGFNACAVGAASLDYPALVAAQQQIDSANAAIARARRMEP